MKTPRHMNVPLDVFSQQLGFLAFELCVEPLVIPVDSQFVFNVALTKSNVYLEIKLCRSNFL